MNTDRKLNQRGAWTKPAVLTFAVAMLLTLVPVHARIKLVALPERGDTIIRLDNPRDSLGHLRRIRPDFPSAREGLPGGTEICPPERRQSLGHEAKRASWLPQTSNASIPQRSNPTPGVRHDWQSKWTLVSDP